MYQVVIADSGSTKTDWAAMTPDGNVTRFSSRGLNPCVQSASQIADLLEEEVAPHLRGHEGASLFFYGAGCRGEAAGTMKEILEGKFRPGRAEVCTDLLGAARALCGKEEGIACIIGTGSNSCIYDDKEIVQQVPPLGFILGDEGSGAVLGKRLLGDILKHRMSDETARRFASACQDDLDTILRKVYKEPAPNRYLASLVPFLHRNRRSADVRRLVLDEFDRFFKRNIDYYGRKDLPLHFTGSVAYHFKDEMEETARRNGYAVGRVRQSPLPGLLDFHRTSCPRGNAP